MDKPDRDREEVAALQIIPVKGQGSEVPAITQLVNALAGVQPLCLEIAGTGLRRFLIVRCRRKDVAMVRSQIISIYGTPDIRELPEAEDPAAVFHDPGKIVKTLRLGLSQPPGLPLRTYRELLENDPLLPILGALHEIKDGEAGLAQLLIHGPAPDNWASATKRELLALQRRQAGTVPPEVFLRWLLILLGAGLVSLYFLLMEWGSNAWMLLVGMSLLAAGIRFLTGSGIRWSEALEEVVARKIQQTGYQVELRLAAAASEEERAQDLLHQIEGAYQIFGLESGNRLIKLPVQTPFDPSSLSLYKPGVIILGEEEIATLWHLPAGDLPDLLHATRVEDTLPDPAWVAASEENVWKLGRMGKTVGEPIPVYLPRSAITRTHALLMGKTRTGKTTALENAIRLIASEMGRSLVAIDPHDDMVKDLLGIIPSSRAGDVIYINFTDGEWIPALNLLDVQLYDGDPERTAEALTEVTKALFKKYWGPRMEVVFERTVLALALANSVRTPAQQFTILDAIQLLNMSQDGRLAFLQSVLPEGHLQRETLLSYFQWEFQELTKSMREQVIMPVLSKLRPFESNSHLLAVFGQSESSFNPMHALRGGKILLVRTGATVLSQEYSNFIGSLLLNMVRRAVLAQADLSPEERTPVSVIVDESQAFTGIDYGAALAQLAKFGGNIILTTQGSRFIGRTLASDEPEDSDAFSKILSNVDTLIVYRISGEDAVALAETEFIQERQPSDLIYLPDHHAFVRFKKDGQVIGPFRVVMDPPPAKDSLVASQVLAGRSNYCLPFSDALEGARQSARRLFTYYASATEVASAAQDGEIRAPEGASQTASRPTGVPGTVESLLEDGIAGLGGGNLLETFDDLLGRLNTQDPEGE